MENHMKNDEAVSPVIATILMVAITVVLAGVLYVWASGLATIQEEPGTRNIMQATDASTDISAAMNDTLIRISWSRASDDLRWSLVTLTVNVGDDVYTCSVANGTDCFIRQTGTSNGIWEHSETIFLVENNMTDISGPGPTVEIWVEASYEGKRIGGSGSLSTIQVS